MGLFGRFKKKSLVIEQLMQEDYAQKYFAECQDIWQTFVPKNGQSETLQGELLRQIEKLRCEAQDNGNINWDEDFVYFCDFLKETLCAQTLFSKDEKERILLILDYMKDSGNYAKQWQEGLIPDDKVDMDKVAYMPDNLYDRIADAIGQLWAKEPKPIPYVKNPRIKR